MTLRVRQELTIYPEDWAANSDEQIIEAAQMSGFSYDGASDISSGVPSLADDIKRCRALNKERGGLPFTLSVLRYLKAT